jgi:hypothetical protein
MTGLAWSVLGLFGAFLFAALGDLVSEEIAGWLDLVPHAILRIAAVQLDPDLRESIYEGEWLPDLIYELRGAESRPITRLIRGVSLALGLVRAARRIARYRALAAEPTAPDGLSASMDAVQTARVVLGSADGKRYSVRVRGRVGRVARLLTEPSFSEDFLKSADVTQNLQQQGWKGCPADLKLLTVLPVKEPSSK